VKISLLTISYQKSRKEGSASMTRSRSVDIKKENRRSGTSNIKGLEWRLPWTLTINFPNFYQFDDEIDIILKDSSSEQKLGLDGWKAASPEVITLADGVEAVARQHRGQDVAQLGYFRKYLTVAKCHHKNTFFNSQWKYETQE